MATDTRRGRDAAAAAVVFCTAAAKREVTQACALAESLRRFHPGAPVHLLLLDRPDGLIRPDAEPFTVIPLDQLPVPDSAALRFGLTAAELRRAVKPHLLAHLFASTPARRLVYLDPDVVALRRLDPLAEALDRRAVAVGPYLPPADGSEPLAGSVWDNPSVVAAARGRSAAYLTWWGSRVREEGSPAADQDRDPFARDRWVVATPGLYRRGDRPAYDWPYTWASFDNGVAIPDYVRAYYRALGPKAAAFGDPFSAAPDGFFDWLTSFNGPNLPPLYRLIYDQRSDLRDHFPDVDGRDREAFLGWVRTYAARDHRVDPAYLRAVLPPAPPPPAAARPRPVTESYGMNVLGFLQSEKGVGEACRTILRAIHAAGIPCAANNWVDVTSTNVDSTVPEHAADNPYPVNLVALNADFTRPLLERMPWYVRGRYNIGLWNWELEWFPEQWHDAFRAYDEVWAPSTFTQRALARVSPVPVYRVPYSIVRPRPRPELLRRDRFGLPPRAFVFLFAFDFHSYVARKNPVALVEAFRRAFGRRRDVHLVLKASRPDAAPHEYAEIVAACHGQPNIGLLPGVLTRDEMYALMGVCDAYAALHRCEGFGLPLAEAMAMGKPVVATDYSANTDFMNESNSFPVRYRMVAIDQDHGPYRRGKLWADPDVGHAAEQMRRVVEEPERTARVAARARADVERSLSPAAVGRVVRQRLATILTGAPAADDTAERQSA